MPSSSLQTYALQANMDLFGEVLSGEISQLSSIAEQDLHRLRSWKSIA